MSIKTAITLVLVLCLNLKLGNGKVAVVLNKKEGSEYNNEAILCPDDVTICWNDEKCCRKKSGKYYCCPYTKDECCKDSNQCCLSGFTCEVGTGKCLENNGQPSNVKIIESVKDWVVCPGGGTECPVGNTCCLIPTLGENGCCPLPNAVCCSVSGRCCPSGYTCDEEGGTCVKHEEFPFVKLFDGKNKHADEAI